LIELSAGLAFKFGFRFEKFQEYASRQALISLLGQPPFFKGRDGDLPECHRFVQRPIVGNVPNWVRGPGA
jgi:indole-3-glycerol phosphate synthase